MNRAAAFSLAGALLLALTGASIVSLLPHIRQTPQPPALSLADEILLVPLVLPEGSGQAPDNLLLAALAADLRRSFTCEIELASPLPLSRLSLGKDGGTLRADTALDDLAHAYHRSGHLLLLGVTGAALSERGESVLGYAQLGGNACVVTTAGLGTTPARLRERLLRSALHQIGHTFGLSHSADPQSVMFDAPDTEALDAMRDCFNEEEMKALRRIPRLHGRLRVD